MKLNSSTKHTRIYKNPSKMAFVVCLNKFYIHKSDYRSFQNTQKVVAGEFEANFHPVIEQLFFQQLGRGVL